MDLEGLGRLIEANHAQNVLMYETVTVALRDQKAFCSGAMQNMHDKITEHETTLTKIKTIGSLLSLVWGVVVLFASTIIESWRR